MQGCGPANRPPFRCPTLEEILLGLIALLPRGRAWQTHEGGPQQGSEIAFDPEAFDEAFDTEYRRPSVLRRFWKAIADPLWFLAQRLCALRLEFWCATHSETHDQWMKEYGLPDACDPFPDLCVKVAAIGGTRCEYYAEIVARMGWLIECVEDMFSCGTRIGCSSSLAGRAKPGARRNAAQLKVIVYLGESEAFSGIRAAPSLAGRIAAGRRLSCPPDLGPLKCLLARIVHAEMQTVYEVRQ